MIYRKTTTFIVFWYSDAIITSNHWIVIDVETVTTEYMRAGLGKTLILTEIEKFGFKWME